jgi:hypothetical protein
MNSKLKEKTVKLLLPGLFLNTLCARWIGCRMEPSESYASGEKWYDIDGSWNTTPPKFSETWKDAGRLLEAMGASLELNDPLFKASNTKTPSLWTCSIWRLKLVAAGSTPPLAIARLCALLYTKGITLEELQKLRS